MIEHNLVRATVIPEIVRLICNYYKISEKEALCRFYKSKTAANYADEETLAKLEANNQIAFRYHGENPNGSLHDIAGIVNEQGNVLGMMPHPERAVEALLGNEDGLRLFKSILKHGHQTEEVVNG